MNFSSRMVDWEPAPEDTRLELLAFEAGITPDELRAWLRDEIERRRGAGAGRAEHPDARALASRAHRPRSSIVGARGDPA